MSKGHFYNDLKTGKSTERYIAELLGGAEAIEGKAEYDLIYDGKKLEVKDESNFAEELTENICIEVGKTSYNQYKLSGISTSEAILWIHYISTDIICVYPTEQMLSYLFSVALKPKVMPNSDNETKAHVLPYKILDMMHGWFHIANADNLLQTVQELLQGEVDRMQQEEELNREAS
jgi:hypothetical protein